MRQTTFIKNLLQIATEAYYEVRQTLESASGITKRDSYYKVRRNTSTIISLSKTIQDADSKNSSSDIIIHLSSHSYIHEDLQIHP